jgi:hypothetical protein
MSVFSATSTRAAPGLLGLDSNRSEEVRTIFLFRLRNAASVNEEATQSESLSDLEEDLDHLLKLEDKGATACRPPPPFLTTTQTQTKSTRRLVLHLQDGVRENSKTRVSPPVGRPLFSTTTRQMTTPNPFRVVT